MASVRGVFKREMVEKYSRFVDADLLLEWLSRPLPQYFRVNTLKARCPSEVVAKLSEREVRVEKLPWFEFGYRVIEGSVTKSIEHSLGYIYVQDGGSMMPPLALEVEENSTVIDLCAAPGSKATQIAQLMGNTGAIVANDVSYERIKLLVYNVQRMGAYNTVVTMMDGRAIPKKTTTRFDFVLVDAPCSSIGEVRRTWRPALRWSQRAVEGFSRLQKQLLAAGFELLKPGGVLVYSTCTFDPEENEEVVDYLLRSRDDADIEAISIRGARWSPGLVKWPGGEYLSELRKTARVYPFHNDTGGYYIARVRRR